MRPLARSVTIHKASINVPIKELEALKSLSQIHETRQFSDAQTLPAVFHFVRYRKDLGRRRK
jgi:hypothetical protein